MKKVLFLMFLLLLMGLGAAGVKAQVRIGGNTPPNPAAALDLNEAEGTTAGTKGLALPRVTLGSNTAPLDGTTANVNGMLVYNTGGSLSAGVYYWDGVEWAKISDGNVLSSGIVDTTMLAPAPKNNSTFIYYNNKWQTAPAFLYYTNTAYITSAWSANSYVTVNDASNPLMFGFCRWIGGAYTWTGFTQGGVYLFAWPSSAIATPLTVTYYCIGVAK